jgi:hypothetical protein
MTVKIRDVLLPALRQRFPDRPFAEGVPPQPVAIFQAEHPAVGDLQILDDGHEVTLVIGPHTHSHFNPYDATLTSAQLAEEVTESVLNFLTDLFADRVLIWSIPGRSGGWSLLTGQSSRIPSEACRLIWSGPTADRSSPE